MPECGPCPSPGSSRDSAGLCQVDPGYVCSTTACVNFATTGAFGPDGTKPVISNVSPEALLPNQKQGVVLTLAKAPAADAVISVTYVTKSGAAHVNGLCTVVSVNGATISCVLDESDSDSLHGDATVSFTVTVGNLRSDASQDVPIIGTPLISKLDGPALATPGTKYSVTVTGANFVGRSSSPTLSVRWWLVANGGTSPLGDYVPCSDVTAGTATCPLVTPAFFGDNATILATVQNAQRTSPMSTSGIAIAGSATTRLIHVDSTVTLGYTLSNGYWDDWQNPFSATVGSAGKTIESTQVKLDIPQGAFTSDTRFSVETLPETATSLLSSMLASRCSAIVGSRIAVTSVTSAGVRRGVRAPQGASATASSCGYVASLAVTWSPKATALKPVVVKVKDANIVAGDEVFILGSSGLKSLGVATKDGEIEATITDDPVLVIGHSPKVAPGYSLVTVTGTLLAYGSRAVTQPKAALAGKVVSASSTLLGTGGALTDAFGHVTTWGTVKSHASLTAKQLGADWVAAVSVLPGGGGYFLATRKGHVFAFGGAHFRGSAETLAPGVRIVAMLPSADGAGYQLVSSTGAVYSFGDAPGFLALGRSLVKRSVVAAAKVTGGHGVVMVDSVGKVTTRGDARFYGDLSRVKLKLRVVGIVATASGKGYTLITSRGGRVPFGDAKTLKAAALHPIVSNVVAVS